MDSGITMTPWPITELDEYELRRDDEERRRRENDNRACGYEQQEAQDENN